MHAYTRSHYGRFGQINRFILPRQHYLPGALNNGLAGIRTQGLRLAKATIFQLIYKPISFGSDSFSISDRYVVIGFVPICLGGDPAADSPTATLLRLNPPCKI